MILISGRKAARRAARIACSPDPVSRIADSNIDLLDPPQALSAPMPFYMISSRQFPNACNRVASHCYFICLLKSIRLLWRRITWPGLVRRGDSGYAGPMKSPAIALAGLFTALASQAFADAGINLG